jgi:hypothetical protein
MKAEHRATRHADALPRHHAQHQRAGRQARPVDHDTLAGFAHAIEQVEEGADLSAGTGENAHFGRRWRDRRA